MNVILEFYLPKLTRIMRVVGTASRKASLSAMFCSYSDFFFIPLSGFWYIDLMTLRAAKIISNEYKVIYLILIPYNTEGRK